MTSLWRHFLSHGFQICIFCGTYQKLSACKACKLSGSSFTEGLQKHNDDVIMTSLHIFGIQKLSSYQVSNSSVILIKFYGDCYKTTQKPLWRHYDVTSQYLVLKIVRFVELNRSYQPAKFHWPRLSGSNFSRAGGKPPQTCNTLSKSPVLIGLKILQAKFWRFWVLISAWCPGTL